MKPGFTFPAIAFIGLFLAACTVIPEPAEVDTYRMPPATIEASGVQAEEALRISRPMVTDLLAGNRVLRLSPNGNFSAYGGVRWSANVPVLWRDWLVDAFLQDGRFAQVSSDVENIQSDYELASTLRALYIEETAQGTQATIRIDMRIVRVSNRSPLAAERFEASVPVQNNRPESAVRALGEASDQVAQNILRWVHRELENK